MAGNPRVSTRLNFEASRLLTAEDLEHLCGLRDELLLLAACAARRATREPELVVCRNTLAHCFEHLAQRLDEVLADKHHTDKRNDHQR
ncbi:hypothetical protein ISP15_01205 [Dyella jejuensis]|uniref:XAC0095-like domain-containing protein n=1 Tax=Dyella jejuensis TaxID=1432009 RepID=A0ABW8JCZ0_9GAMM